MTIDRRGGVPRLPFGSCEPAGSVCGDPPLRPKSLSFAHRADKCGRPSQDVPGRRFSLYDRVWRVEIKHLQSLIMHPDSHLWLIRVVAFLRQRAVRRPGRGRLSVGRQSTAGAPAGRKPLKSRKARNRLLHCQVEQQRPPSCHSWSRRPQCLVPLPPAVLGANGGCTATGGGGSEESGR